MIKQIQFLLSWTKYSLNSNHNKIRTKYDLIAFIINAEKEKYGCYEEL